MIPLSKSAGPLKQQIYRGLKDAILSSRLVSGEKLPSTRELAEQLGVSRTVVMLAYEQLLAEGYIHGRSGSGTYVAQIFHPAAGERIDVPPSLSRFGEAALSHVTPLLESKRNEAIRYDFSIGRSNLDLFPFQAWRRLLLNYAQSASVRAYDYRSPSGSIALRESIARHLRRSRGVQCEPSQIVIVSGAQQALDLTCRLLVNPGERVVMEDPHYLGTREVLRAIGARMHPVAVDEDGLKTDLPKSAKLAIITPSHQFPTGAIMSLSRRLELLAWAQRTNAFVLEDDYDGEFRYNNHPLEALQSLDREGRVIYIGSFSRTMFSSMRIGYVVLPLSLVLAFTATKWLADRHTATLEQETLAAFIDSGMYERHLRRVRRHNARRQAVLLAALRRYVGASAQITGEGSGEHIVLWLPPSIRESDVVARAEGLGVRVSGLTRHFLLATKRPALLLGYVRLNDAQMDHGVRLLAEALRPAIAR